MVKEHQTKLKNGGRRIEKMKKDLETQKGDVLIYQGRGGKSRLEVRLVDKTVWLTQTQMARLFVKDRRTISEHLSTVFKEKELDRISTIRKFRIVQKEGRRNVEREVDHYNLDVIISVGYRVKSKRGTQFRIWATNVLRNHLVKGYTIYERRLKKDAERRRELEETLKLIEAARKREELKSTEAEGLLAVITEYTRSWLLLHQFDTGKMAVDKLNRQIAYEITYDEAQKAIEALKGVLILKNEAGELFGRENAAGKLNGILRTVNQTFGGKELYPSLEEKAAHLLYFVIKDHPFVDGNKRIASLLFIWFLERNSYLSTAGAERKINDNALVALALLVAESNPAQKELMVKLIINLIAQRT